MERKRERVIIGPREGRDLEGFTAKQNKGFDASSFSFAAFDVYIYKLLFVPSITSRFLYMKRLHFAFSRILCLHALVIIIVDTGYYLEREDGGEKYIEVLDHICKMKSRGIEEEQDKEIPW
ncbi:hypothetical protein E1A91_A02G005600v1 [Gossypium mustelinum]|uniref:Uncharacterized protein n=1 Tax=Gossypium mustelinum TaxID=34275 RepID=A0A5D3A005_GOSMU|nr:hypothetical protein E1A91_A02G005600v1 [Gossypium mustelinum]